jgi:hypothetical protein
MPGIPKLDEPSFEAVLIDADRGEEHTLRVKVAAVCEGYGLDIYADGFGCDASYGEYGSPVFLEYRNGHLRLIVWGDINKEDPTHTIDLDGALESNRKLD